MKRVALTVGSPGLDVEVEPRFGRAAYILLVDPDTMDWESVRNSGRDAWGGAGVRVAQVLDDRNVTDVVSGEFGPKAFEALKAAGIRMHRLESSTTAREAVEQLKAGDLAAVGTPSPGRRRGRGRW
jgi:predicted Fe-Mo cluster-binding NifX family protein